MFLGKAYAQDSHLQPLEGKRVAVYFSRKHFNFDDNYRIPLSQFIRSNEGRDAEIEDIKLQTLVALGSMFSQQLKQPSQADSIYFLNEQPEMASAFLQAYDSEDHSLQDLGNEFLGTDYILVINPLILGSYKKNSVYSHSNRIITEQIIVKTARMRMELFEPSSGNRVSAIETCMDERESQVPNNYFEFNMEYSITGKFLAHLFSLAVDNLNQGQGNCPKPE
jgi:hypothetical protein